MTSALALALFLAQAPDAGVVTSPVADDAEADSEEVPLEPSERIDLLERELAKTRAELEGVKKRQDWFARLSAKLSGYVDVGFFWVQGNGSGVRKDLSGALGYRGEVLDTWVLEGDPLSTSINSRGDVADVGDSRAIRFDPVHAGAHPSFIVNAFNLGLFAGLGDTLGVLASIDFLPRDRDISDPRGLFLGDFFDLKLAYVRYQLDVKWLLLTLSAGKVDSLLGIEYRTQDSPDRITVTPSLICRYTCGRPVGVRARADFFERRLEVGLALTNGTHQVDFFPFTNETEHNTWKTVAGRIALRLPIGKGFELNASGAVGPQDRQPDDSVLQWHYGLAGMLELGDFTFMAEFVAGKAPGKPDGALACGAAPCLAYRGAYGLVAWRATGFLQPYVRADWRSARHINGIDYAYVSDLVRTTLGVRADVNRWVILKAEYTFNLEVPPLRSFADDVFTTSVVVRY